MARIVPPKPITREVDQIVMACPACSLDIIGKATVTVTFADPANLLADPAAISFPGTGVLDYFSVSHTCSGRTAMHESDVTP